MFKIDAAKLQKIKSPLEREFYLLLSAEKSIKVAPLLQYRFASPRRFALDFAWPELMTAVEIQGGQFMRPVICHNCKHTVKRKIKGNWYIIRAGGGHSTEAGLASDYEKSFLLQQMGWKTLYLTTKTCKDPRSIGKLLTLMHS